MLSSLLSIGSDGPESEHKRSTQWQLPLLPAPRELPGMIAPAPDALRVDVDVCYLAHAFEGLDTTPLPVACVHLEPQGHTKPCGALSKRVVLLCDVSGSMSQQIPILRDTVQHIHNDLAADDELGVVVFDDVAEVALHMTRKRYIEDLAPCLRKISSGGTTNIEAALRAAWDITADASRSTSSPGPQLPTVWLLLSDGKPNRGEQGQEALVKLARDAAQACHPVVIHSLGFGHGHDVSMMCALASTGSVAPGAYTFLEVNADIPAAVGDILGMFSNAPAMVDLSLDASWRARCEGGEQGGLELEDGHEHLPPPQKGLFAFRCGSERGGQLELSRDSLRFPALFPDRVETVLALCDVPLTPPGQALAAQEGGTLQLSLSWRETGSESQRHLEHRVCLHERQASVDLAAVTGEGNSKPLEQLPTSGLVVVGHVLRLRVAAALVLCDEIQRTRLWQQDAQRWNSIFEPLVQLHGTVLAVLCAIRQRMASQPQCCASGTSSTTSAGSSDRQLKLAEGFLQALERDLGEALTVKAAERIGDQRLCGVFLAFAHEHFAMRSASSMTACRTTYASSQQLQARFRFIRGVAGSGGEDCPKSQIKPEQLEPSLAVPGELTEEDLHCRRQADDISCFYTLGSWRECLLGIGLYVHERSVRDRQHGLPPEMDLVPDYVSAEAYNEGVRSSELSEPGHGQGQDSGLVSSARGRINGWIPLYLNETNWREARLWAPSALSLLSTQLAGAFNPKPALKAFARILCGAMVSFSRPQACDRPEAAKLSLRTLQLCADVHRLFLAVARDHPVMSQEADACLVQFRDSPRSRTRQVVPNLGDLLQYLLLSSCVKWADIAASFAFEMLRREAGRMETGLDLNKILPPGQGEGEPDDLVSEKVLQAWDEKAPGHGLVVLLSLQLVKALRPPDRSIEEVCDGYDRKWGRLPDNVLHHLLSEGKRIQAITSVRAVLTELLGDAAGSLRACAQLVLDANAMRCEEEYGRAAQKAGDKMSVPATETSHDPGRGATTWHWLDSLRAERWLWQVMEQSVRPPPSHLPPMQKRRRRGSSRLTGVGDLVAELGWHMTGDELTDAPKETEAKAEGSLQVTGDTSAAVSSAETTKPQHQRRHFRHGGDVKAWRNAPWDAERARKTLVLARLPAAGQGEDPEAVLRTCGLDGLVMVRVRREAGSKRGRERRMAFVEFVSEAAAEGALQRLRGDEAMVERGWVVDRAKRGVDPAFVPHRFQGELLWERVNQRKRQRDRWGPRERHSRSRSRSYAASSS